MNRYFLAALLSAALWTGFVSHVARAQQAPAEDRAKPAVKEPIDFDKARTILQKRKSGAKLTADEEAYLRAAMEARQRGSGKTPDQRPATAQGGKDHIGQKPLTEMSADDRYKGEDGGLYGQGRNTPPEPHQNAAEAETARIQPLDAQGKPAQDGKIGLISISMSNATQEFSAFKQIADRDREKSPRVSIVDCAQGGQAMAEWVDPQAQPWTEAQRRLKQAELAPEQVQVAWIKLANKGPRGDLKEHGKKLADDTRAVIHNAKVKFPNLRVVYLGSRIYGGYASNTLNPEPYAYESAIVVRWLIQDQIKGEKQLNYDEARGPVQAPLLLWGPYFWGDGVTPRKADGLVWELDDFARDGTHPSNSGRKKVADMLLDFFKTDPLAKTWFVAGK